MNSSSKTKILSLLIILISFLGYAQKNKPAIESFEKEAVLSKYRTINSTVSTSESYYKFGDKSLKWTWSDAGSFETSNFKFLTIDESPLAYGKHFPASPTLQMDIYNENPQSETITISYEKDGKKEETQTEVSSEQVVEDIQSDPVVDSISESEIVEEKPVPVPEPIVVEQEQPKEAWTKRLTKGLSKSSSKLTTGITDIFTKRKLDDAAIEELEEL